MDTKVVGHHHEGTHYVVSEDIDLIVSRWCNGLGLTSPDLQFYAELRSRMKSFLCDIFTKVTFVDSQYIRNGLLESVSKYKQDGLTVVNLERVYLEDSEVDFRIELTRTVTEWGDDVVIPSVRHGTRQKRYQFEALRNKKLVLVDDVVFSGKTLISTITELQYYQALTQAVTVAVGVRNGVDRLKKANFGVLGMPDHMSIDCMEEFDHVSDQVCERDFYPGLPYSGRQHASHNFASFPYILPFGKPGKWASIPEKEVRDFSILCLDNTITLFREIERINDVVITSAMISRPVFGIPQSDLSFADVLAEARHSL